MSSFNIFFFTVKIKNGKIIMLLAVNTLMVFITLWAATRGIGVGVGGGEGQLRWLAEG